MDDNADYDGCVKKDPANTSKINGLVVLAYSVNKPESRRKKIRSPRN